MGLLQKEGLAHYVALLLADEKKRERYKKETSDCYSSTGKYPENRHTLIKECGEELAMDIEKRAYEIIRKEDEKYASSDIYPMVQRADSQLSNSEPPTIGSYAWGYHPFDINAAYMPLMEYLEMVYTHVKKFRYSTKAEPRYLCIIDDVCIVPPYEFIDDPTTPDVILCNCGFIGSLETIVHTRFLTPRVCDLHHVLAVVCTDGRWYLLRTIPETKGDVRIMLPYQVEQMFGADVEAYIKEKAEKEAAEEAKCD